jgi:3-oxoacyl-[acyl-carrier-protein] synthase II
MGAESNGRRRVVVTGLGMVSPLGNTVEDSWSALVAAESGAAKITQFDTTGFPVDFACEVKDLDVTDYVDYKASRRMDRFTHLALAAARQAEADAGLDIAAEPERIGAAVATGIGGLKSFESCIQVLDERGPDRVNPFSIVQIIPNLAAGWVSMELGTKGPLLSECTACAASNMALGDGLDAIRLGRADVMICGGTEAPVSRVGIAGFGAMRAISRRNGDPKRASRPFDAERDGSSSERRRAAPRSTPSCSATASRRTRRTSPTPTRPAAAPRVRSAWLSTMRASRPTRSGTSTRTGPRRRWATSRRRA